MSTDIILKQKPIKREKVWDYVHRFDNKYIKIMLIYLKTVSISGKYNLQ
jgi:hypothetical protein